MERRVVQRRFCRGWRAYFFGRRLFDQGMDEPVSPAWDRLDEPRVNGGVAECATEAVDCGVQSVLEIAKGTRRPQGLLQFFAGDDLSSGVNQQDERLESLTGKPNPRACLLQLARVREKFEVTEPDGRCGRARRFHLRTPCQEMRYVQRRPFVP